MAGPKGPSLVQSHRDTSPSCPVQQGTTLVELCCHGNTRGGSTQLVQTGAWPVCSWALVQDSSGFCRLDLSRYTASPEGLQDLGQGRTRGSNSNTSGVWLSRAMAAQGPSA